MVSLIRAPLITATVFSSLALPMCVFRLWIRFNIQRVGWDDIWAAVTFLCGAMAVASNWAYIIKAGAGDLVTVSNWIYMISFTGLLWAVRISVILSILRFIPTRERLYTYGLSIVTFFLLCCTGFLVQEIVICSMALHEFQPTPSMPHFRCISSQATNITQIAVGLFADMVTVCFPLCVLHTMTLQPKRHRLLRLLFSSCIAVSLVCSVRAASQFIHSLAAWAYVIDTFQVAVCLVVCNIVVITTYLYRVFGHRHGSSADATDDDTFTESSNLTIPMSFMSSRGMTLTTVELFFSRPHGESASTPSNGGTLSKSRGATVP